ncbi:hypothetical protein GF374_02775 [Candidatus Woesearchaeota archaeon]|nr:hypothetical protein [Candidatus Woesearchaeota archaeon]
MPRRKSKKGTTKIQTSGRPRHKSSSMKKIRRRTPSGKTKIVYKHKKPGKHKCAVCGALLHGKPRGRPVEIKRLNKSKRKPERPFGGKLCSKCSRKIQSLRAKLKHGVIKEEDIPLSLMKYVK